MDDVSKLKLLILESKYPYFTDEELGDYLTLYGGDVYKTASQLCLMKADSEKSIKIGPVEIENPDPAYWQKLSTQYSNMSIENSSTNTGNSYYATSMPRSDELC